jgi:hypothetical protein
MADNPNLWRRWESYRPSKTTWLWSCVACVIATLIIGFTAGGWTTSGTAAQMARTAADDATNKVVAGICVGRFQESPDASTQLAMLKKAATWDRDYFIEKGGWVTLPGAKAPVTGAADLCVNQLLTAAEPPPTSASGSS